MDLHRSDTNSKWREKLTKHEDHLLDLLQSAPSGSTILGFLHVSESQQTEIVNDLKAAVIQSLASLLRQFPAVTAYSLALSRAKADEDGKKFWDCIEEGTGKKTSILDREKLSHQFQSTCQNLGLKTGGIGQKANIAPFIYQAGIMFFWERGENSYLSNGYRTTVKTTPIPSADDWERCRQFATELASHCYGSKNLKNILNDDLGALLVQRLVQYYEGDEFALPPHLRDAFKRERREGRKLRLPSPYLFFDRYQNEVILVLPAVQASLADEGTTWEWNGNKYFASHERKIPLKATQFKQHEVLLNNLLRGYQDQTFRVNASLNNNTPFRIFTCRDGKERVSNAGRTSELPAGAYHIVAHSDLQAGEDEDHFLNREDFRVCSLEDDYELRPGDPALELSHEEKRFQISCRIEPGFFMGQESSQSLALSDGSRIHWGTSLEFSGYLPIGSSASEEIILEISSPSLEAPHVCTLERAHQGSLQFTEEFNEPLLDATKNFQPGIHSIKIILRQGQIRATRRFFYWKGLKHVSELSGFYCSVFPENVEASKSRGLKKEDSNLLFNADKSPIFQIALNDGHKLEFQRPGVRMAIIDDQAEEEDLPASIKSITVTKDDRRRLAFYSGGFQSWDIRCGSYTIGQLSQTKTTHIASMRSILNEGGNGPILAFPRDTPSDGPISLSRLYSPVTCKQPSYRFTTAEEMDSWHLSFEISGLYELGIKIWDLSDSPDAQPGPVNIISSQTDEFLEKLICPVPGISIRTHSDNSSDDTKELNSLSAAFEKVANQENSKKVRLSIRIDTAEIKQRFYLIDILHRESESHEWEFANARESIGNSLLRFPIFGSAHPTPNSPWWHFVRHSRQSEKYPDLPDEALSALRNLSSEQLDQALSTCQKLLNFQYPKSVWTNPESRHQAKWIENWSHALSDKRLLSNKKHAPTWWWNAAHELNEFVGLKNSPINKSFLFGSSREILFNSPAEIINKGRDTRHSPRLVQALGLGHDIKEYGGTIKVAQSHFTEEEEYICKDTFHYFKNIGAVGSGTSSEFGRFNFRSYFDDLTKKIEDEEFDDEKFLLSPDHLNDCCRALTKRSRVLEHASSEQRTKGLSGLTTQIQASHSRLTKATSFLAEHLHLEREFVTHRTKDTPDKEFQKHWTPPGLTNPFARRVADLIWCLTATTRLAAHGHISQKEANQILDLFFLEASYGQQPLRISALLSFGPELFAFYIALFDFAFSESLTQ
ncbi:hypothetical protein N9Z02_00780 [Akkermansiaceae bacterium]|nr:hypothetical protein [Akkermansiaceae bacterium]